MGRTSQRHVPLALFVVALALAGARAASYFVAPAAAAGSVQWIALEALQGSRPDKPILFLFTAEWSAPGRAFEAEVLQAPDLAREINERFIPVRIVDRRREEGRNLPRVDELQRRFAVRGFPTIVISDRNGNELARMEGAHDREDLEQVLRRFR